MSDGDTMSPTAVPNPTRGDMPVGGEGLDDATVYRDIPYGPDERHRIDLYVPLSPRHEWTPVVLYIHGGGWLWGDKDAAAGAGEFTRLLSDGWAIASMNYRFVQYSDTTTDPISSNVHPTQIRDVKRAIRFIKAHSASCVRMPRAASLGSVVLDPDPTSCPDGNRLSLDPAMVVVAGFSAGGHLALLAGTACRRTSAGGTTQTDCPEALEPSLSSHVARDAPLIPQDSRPVAVVAESPVIDIAAALADVGNGYGTPGFSLSIAVRMFLGCLSTEDPCDAGLVNDASPLFRLDASDPPVYLSYGSADKIVPPENQGQAAGPVLASVLGRKRVWVDRMDVPEGGHDTRFLNVTALSEFLEQVRRGSMG